MVKRTASAATLRAVVARYTRHNDRFEQLLNARDAEQRERTRTRLLARGEPGRALLASGERDRADEVELERQLDALAEAAYSAHVRRSQIRGVK
jgi:hypothetical protein